MTPLWDVDEIAGAVKGEAAGEVAEGVGGISIDSRSVQSGDLFIALSGDPGPRFGGGNMPGARDGHEFIQGAVDAGAAAVLASKPVETDACVIQVQDTLNALWDLGTAARQRLSDAHCIAITGSSGKTTLRHWLEPVCARFGRSHASTGSLNNHWGVPLSMARMPRDTDIGIFEVGTNHPGEIAPLSRLVRPHVAVLLNVLPAHIGNFPDMAALTREKLSIAEGLEDGGVFVLPHALKSQSHVARRLTFGFERDADITGNVEAGRLTVEVDGKQFPCQPPYLDRGRCQSVLAIFAVCHALGYDLQAVAESVASLDLPVGRGNQHLVSGVTLIDDSYNANPVSMTMAIEDLLNRGRGQRIALLGEMLELGDMAPEAHTEVLAAAQDVDRVITFGDGFSQSGSAEHVARVDDFDLTAFAKTLAPGDTVLIKGSNRVFWQQRFVQQLLECLQGPAPAA